MMLDERQTKDIGKPSCFAYTLSHSPLLLVPNPFFIKISQNLHNLFLHQSLSVATFHCLLFLEGLDEIRDWIKSHHLHQHQHNHHHAN